MSDQEEGVAFLAKEEKEENRVKNGVKNGTAADEGAAGGVLACSDGSKKVDTLQNFDAGDI